MSVLEIRIFVTYEICIQLCSTEKKKKKLNTLVSEVKTPWIQTSIPPHSRCDIQFLSFLYCKNENFKVTVTQT